MNIIERIVRKSPVLLLAALVACGGGPGDSSTAAGTYTIAGTVIGMKSGATIDLVNGSATLTVANNGTFTFPNMVADHSLYNVIVKTPPTGQGCAVLNGAGTISTASVLDVEVYCTTTVTAATLNGNYAIASLNVNTDSDQLYTSVPFNGSGTEGAASVITNTGGTTFTTSTSAAGSYSVSTVVALASLTLGAHNVGAISDTDGDEFYWLQNGDTGGNPPALFLAVKPLLTATQSTLTGNWISVGLTQAATPYVSEGPLTINSDGSFTATPTILTSAGAVSMPAVSGPTNSYTVTNGAVGIGSDSGYVSANGEFMLLTSATQQAGGASANYPGLSVAIKQGTGVTIATVNGIYSVVGMGFASATTGDGDMLSLYFDGVGNFNGPVTDNQNGTYTSNTLSGTYTVSSSGVLTLTDSNSNTYSGGVTADGNIMVLGYVTASTSQIPRMFVGFKQ